MVFWYLDGIQLDKNEIKKRRNGKKIILFGADEFRNKQLFQFIDKNEIICIFDNDKHKWGSEIEGIRVVKPFNKTQNIILMSGIHDWNTISRQIVELGYSEIYFFLTEEWKIRWGKYIELFSPENYKNYIWPNLFFKYIHVIPDEKFFEAVIEYIEYGMNIKEHFFIIYNMNVGNENDRYRVWDKYKKLSEQFHNIYIVHNELCYLSLNDWETNKEKLDKLLMNADKILFHGEWFTEKVYKYFFAKLGIVHEKGIFIPWSGEVGTLAWTNTFIEGVLQYSRMITLNKYSYEGQNILKNFPLTEKANWFNNGCSYARLTKPIKKKNKNTKNILIAHSCDARAKGIETIKYLSERKGNVYLYCITSYGPQDVVKEVENYGKTYFGDHFISVKEYMRYEDYVQFLAQIDVAVFGMETLLGRDTLELLFLLGAKVYLKPKSSASENMISFGYKVHNYYDIKNETDEELFNNTNEEWNYSVARNIAFDPEKKFLQWKELYEYEWEK